MDKVNVLERIRSLMILPGCEKPGDKIDGPHIVMAQKIVLSSSP